MILEVSQVQILDSFFVEFDSSNSWFAFSFPKKEFEFNLTVSELEVKQRKVQNDNAQVWPANLILD